FGSRSQRRRTPGPTDVRCARSASRVPRKNAATAVRGLHEATILNTQASCRNRMRGPYSDYAAPPIYVTREPTGPRPGVRFSRQELFQLGATGATMVSGYVTRDQNGRISAAGPVSNLVIGTTFMLAAAAIVRTSSLTNLLAFFVTIILVNAWYLNVILAGFNMIPIMP